MAGKRTGSAKSTQADTSRIQPSQAKGTQNASKNTATPRAQSGGVRNASANTTTASKPTGTPTTARASTTSPKK
ncbi:hypothetical protein BV25DRAFT_1911995 [Artomyces pyxidatus]|uniref:Uncharacterized protein n=1 Tax=Artomyces pyxidatus TaxID=48021 RepID=A0ACB8TFZ1_9AGAM|nr:hypothetical protein BV25DRAFT_1911995 [Artomyces pyxidatus]